MALTVPKKNNQTKACSNKTTIICDSVYASEGHKLAPPRIGNDAKAYSCGHDYFKAVYDEIQKMKSGFIYIADWSFDLRVHLKRNTDKKTFGKHDENTTVLNTLVNAAKKGIQIRIFLFDCPAPVTMGTYDDLNEEVLHSILSYDKERHNNIQVMRHRPNYSGTPTFAWSHHQKFVVLGNVDDKKMVAYLGGLDLTHGRYDTPDHPLTDGAFDYTKPAWNPNEPKINLDNKNCYFREKDYYNPCITDFDRTEHPRMPWQDVSLRIEGTAAWDVYHNFVQKWNKLYEPLNHTAVHIRINGHNFNKLKALYYATLTDETDPKNSKKGCNIFGYNCDRDKKTNKILWTINRTQSDRDKLVEKYNKRENGLRKFLKDNRYIAPDDNKDYGSQLLDLRNQLFRSGDPSNKGRHIRQTIKLIDKSKFNEGKGSQSIQIVRSISKPLGSFKFETSIHEVFCRAIQGAKHYVYIESQYLQSKFGNHKATNHVLPLLINKILDVWYINQGIKYQNEVNAEKHKENKKLGINKEKIPAEKEKVFRAYLVYPIHPEGNINEPPGLLGQPTLEYMYWQFQSTHRTTIKSKEDDDTCGQFTDDILQADGKKSSRAKDGTSRSKAGFNIEQLGGMIGALEEKMGKMYHITYIPSDPKARMGETEAYDRAIFKEGPGYDDITKYFKLFSLRNHGEIKGKAVTEQVYVHSKMMIVDDRVAIIGSANVSDRSFTGDGDSELSAVILDRNKEYHNINGIKTETRKFARDLRIKLWEQHLGPSSKGKVDDPVHSDTHKLMCDTARDNAKYYDDIFPGIPSDKYATFEEQNHAAQHAQGDYNSIKSNIKGHIVDYPLFWGWSEPTIADYLGLRNAWFVKNNKKAKKKPTSVA